LILEITKSYTRAVRRAFSDGRVTKECAIEVLGLRDHSEFLPQWISDRTGSLLSNTAHLWTRHQMA
jgi:hypothetical protein